MDFVDRVWSELVEETTFVASRLQQWWGSMAEGEQLMLLGIVCAACLLLGLRAPATGPQYRAVDANPAYDIAKQFLFAGVVLLIFTFGADIAIESLT